jgi:hypothetical protein
MIMVQYSDNEIQVLGSTSKRSSKKWMWSLPLLVVGITWVLLVTLGKEETVDIKHFKTELKAPSPRQPEPEMTSGVEYETQVVNDVWLNVYKILDMHAELSLDVSVYTDSTECIILQAADIRKDNRKFVGDFVLNGEKLSSGKVKKGYCAIVDGKVTIGMSADDEVMNHCMANGGSFFRQYPLVVDGVMQPSNVKGKSIRRALAQNEDGLYIVMTDERESVHNFSEALVDMGMKDAISLVGGNKAYMYWMQEDECWESDDLANVDNRNFIVFRRKE